jgi:uncharacterized protein YeaO (DUF488 family)
MTMIQIKRVYDPAAKEDGAQFFVERLWPRGMKKEALPMDAASNGDVHQCPRPIDMLTVDFDE